MTGELLALVDGEVGEGKRGGMILGTGSFGHEPARRWNRASACFKYGPVMPMVLLLMVVLLLYLRPKCCSALAIIMHIRTVTILYQRWYQPRY